MQTGILDLEKFISKKNKRTILREENLKEEKKKEKKEKLVDVRKTEEGESLREVTVKIGLKRIDILEGMTIEVLLDSGATGW